ncbi:MAG: reductive dehalogenase domain-containing protein, partial [Anaerolineae bacterium]
WLPSPKEVAAPSYAADQVGGITRWDERETLFARRDLWRYFGPETGEHQAYYAAHPQHLTFDRKLDGLPVLGHIGGLDMPLFDAQFESVVKIAGEAFVDGQPAAYRSELSPERAAQKVKALARFLGADLVGIGPLRQEWIYTHVGRSFGNREGFEPWGTPVDLGHHPHAIALGFQMDYDLIQHAPDFPTLLATAQGYGSGAWVSIQLAEYIRMLGHSARAHHLYNYRVLVVPVAVDCGLGELSRAGYLLTREFGLAVRLAVVTCDLPLAHDKPVDIGVQSYCHVCKICAESCPIGAIPHGEKVAHSGVKKWKLDEEKCYRYWHAVGTDCSLCMTTCPWTKRKTAFHQAMGWLASIKGPHQAWMARADQWLYGPHKPRPRPTYMEPRRV